MVLKLISSIVDNINVHYYGDFIDEKTADYFFELAEKNMVYNSAEESKVFIFGKYYKIPRKQVAYGEKGITYKFSGNVVSTIDWNNENDEICKYLRYFRDKIKRITGEEYNFVLINRYKDGYDNIGSHADDEKDLGKNPNIVGISFGEERNIIFHSKKKPQLLTQENIALPLKHGSLYIMYHPTNIYWKHSLPKDINAKNPRISLTYRKMVKNNI